MAYGCQGLKFRGILCGFGVQGLGGAVPNYVNVPALSAGYARKAAEGIFLSPL